MSGGADKMPRYSHRGLDTSPSEWEPDEDDVRRAQIPQRGGVLRGLSVAPFALVAAVGLIAFTLASLLIVELGLSWRELTTRHEIGQP